MSHSYSEKPNWQAEKVIETNEGGMLTEMYVDGGRDGASQGFCLQAEGYQLTASITLPHRPPLSEFGTTDFLLPQVELGQFPPLNQVHEKFSIEFFFGVFSFMCRGLFLKRGLKCKMTDTEPDCHSQPRPADFFFGTFFGLFLRKF